MFTENQNVSIYWLPNKSWTDDKTGVSKFFQRWWVTVGDKKYEVVLKTNNKNNDAKIIMWNTKHGRNLKESGATYKKVVKVWRHLLESGAPSKEPKYI